VNPRRSSLSLEEQDLFQQKRWTRRWRNKKETDRRLAPYPLGQEGKYVPSPGLELGISSCLPSGLTLGKKLLNINDKNNTS
jgi:hypothetical protein